MNIHKELAKVESNKLIAHNIYEAYLYAPKISKEVKAGQFINILPSDDWSKVMRRPMSVASQGNDCISIIYKVFGEGTLKMSQWKKNDYVDIIGPLGNYWSDFEDEFPILIGGGVGIAPIINLHNELINKGINHILIVGAKEKKEHFISHNPDKGIYLSTDDNDYGIKGNVIIALDQILKTVDNKIKIFTCGPHGMMHAIKKYCKDNEINCDFAVETIMACGVGICQGCTIVRNTETQDSYREKYALACVDGPVFNIGELDDSF